LERIPFDTVFIKPSFAKSKILLNVADAFHNIFLRQT